MRHHRRGGRGTRGCGRVGDMAGGDRLPWVGRRNLVISTLSTAAVGALFGSVLRAMVDTQSVRRCCRGWVEGAALMIPLAGTLGIAASEDVC